MILKPTVIAVAATTDDKRRLHVGARFTGRWQVDGKIAR
jgi:hypothetical protein